MNGAVIKEEGCGEASCQGRWGWGGAEMTLEKDGYRHMAA